MADIFKLENELFFRTSRSGGSGGQNVNKVETRVELWFDIVHTENLSNDEKQLINEKLATRINKEGLLRLVSSKERSQLMNKKAVVEKFFRLIEAALVVDELRISTKPTRASRIRRITQKVNRSEIKKSRGKQWRHDE